ncbi:MAG TPA: hypothetical protein DEP28_12310 [Bacteroidetes bacterium]|nr:hypothetical protein [Bacteroidota bacterium]
MAGPNRRTSQGMSTDVDRMKEFDAKVLKLMNNLLEAKEKSIRHVLELERGYSDVTYQDFKKKFADHSKKIETLKDYLKQTSNYYRENIRLTEKHLSIFFNS